MRLAKLSSLAGAIALLATTGGTGPATAQDVSLVFAATGPPTVASRRVVLRDFQNKYDELTGGKVKVKFHLTGDLCVEHQCVEYARIRSIDTTILSCGNMGAFGLTMNFTELPYIFKDSVGAKKVLDGWLRKKLIETAQTVEKVQTMGIFPSGGFRGLNNNIKQIKVPGDLKGIKIRTTKSPAEFSIIDAWGAIATPYDWAQMWEGLQNKVVNGMYIPWPWLYQVKMYEVITHFTKTGGLWGGNVMVMDRARYLDLPKDIQKATDEVGIYMTDAIFEADKAWEKSSWDDLKAQGVNMYEPTEAEMALWRDGAINAWKKLKGTFDPKDAERTLADQGMTDIIAKMKKAGVL